MHSRKSLTTLSHNGWPFRVASQNMAKLVCFTLLTVGFSGGATIGQDGLINKLIFFKKSHQPVGKPCLG